MQAASLVNATAAPRNKADASSTKAQEGGQGSGTFADLLNKAEEGGDNGEPETAGTLPSQQINPRGAKVGRKNVDSNKPTGPFSLERGETAKDSSAAALREDLKAVAEGTAEVLATGIGSTDEAAEHAEAAPEKNGDEAPVNPELVAWLAGLLPRPATAQDAAKSKPLQPAEAAGITSGIKLRLPNEVKLATKGEKAAGTEDRASAQPTSSAGFDQPNIAVTDPPVTAARSKLGGTAAADVAPKASTQSAPTETGASSAQPALKPLSSETTASQAPVPTSALGVQSPKDNLPATSPPSAMRSEAFVQTSVHNPAFAPAFSARIATLARDGLELARVHLNPVDMGPVSVQLSLEGQQVRVDMTADVAATRRVLEQALPSLAGALREAGFTLSGGGVHQPPTDARQSTSQDGGSNNSSHPQGTGTSDNLNASAGGAGGQGAAANPFRDTPQNQGAFTNSQLLTVVEEGALSATSTPVGLEGRPSAGLVDVFA